jgi:hypothetical protein
LHRRRSVSIWFRLSGRLVFGSPGLEHSTKQPLLIYFELSPKLTIQSSLSLLTDETGRVIVDQAQQPEQDQPEASAKRAEEEDPFPSMTDDDIRQGFETLLGYIPRESHPSVQQLGFRGYFKQKVEEMNARELFPFTSAVAQGDTEVVRKTKEAKESETEGYPSSNSEEKRKNLRGREGLGRDGKRRAHSGASGKLVSKDKKKVKQGSAEAEADKFLKGLLGRWESVYVEEARLVFEELNGWAPLEARIAWKGENKVKDWYRGRFERMVESGRRFLRTPATNGERCKYLWADWGKAQFPEALKSFQPRTCVEKEPKERESGSSAGAGASKNRKAWHDEEGISKRVEEEPAINRKTKGVGSKAEVTSEVSRETSEDPASAVIQGLLGRWEAASLEEIARVFKELNGWCPIPKAIDKPEHTLKSWYEERFRRMGQEGTRLVRLASGPHSAHYRYCYRHWSVVGDGKAAGEEAALAPRVGEESQDEAEGEMTESTDEKKMQLTKDMGADEPAGRGLPRGRGGEAEESSLHVTGEELEERGVENDVEPVEKVLKREQVNGTEVGKKNGTERKEETDADELGGVADRKATEPHRKRGGGSID